MKNKFVFTLAETNNRGQEGKKARGQAFVRWQEGQRARGQVNDVRFIGVSSYQSDKNVKDKKCAFTLAETLITLVIVGIVAALTVPNLIVKYQKEQTVTRLKKAYSTLSQALNKSIADNGPTSSWDSFGNNTQSYDSYVKKYFIPYLNVSKICNSQNLTSCWKSCNKSMSTWVCALNGSVAIWVDYAIILTDGTIIGYTFTGYPAMYVNIDGAKNPNKVGKDIFVFSLDFSKNKLLFYSQTSNRISLINRSDGNGGGCNNKKRRYDGWDCGALIQVDGWKISDDYPW